ncbi:phenazine biosynthesis-like domain-containing protein [Gigantopelta aegis]|uniref:phenazine biosynthesis-like domain-containing protein n=1 Tax=Gigantopelta aegis TaxID=1735272 RepID=UPI001B88BE8B|nr:phenazine biosynthesis-like domain-containing protein [Gigantopelta aegis]
MSRVINLPIYTVDAFTDVVFKGNPAAVCPLSDDILCDDVLQKIAAEMNQSETAFIRLLGQGDTFEKSDTFGLRWFTPATEVKLCGHATLASAAILFNNLGMETGVVMDFPLGRTVSHSKDNYGALIKSLGDIPGVEDLVFCKSLRYLLIRLKDGWSRCQFEDWTPDINQMQPSTDDLFVLIVTTRGSAGQGFQDNKGKEYDFVSRVFGPWAGIPEDPVTGKPSV